MQIYRFFSIVLLVINLFNYAFTIEPLSFIVGAGSMLTHYTWCKLKECCGESHIPADFNKLERLLKEKVFGQHLVQDVVLNALKAHWNNPNSQKPLTLSFHGWAGGGKNYVTSFIIQSLYTNGEHSKYVHFFSGRIHFPLESKADEYGSDLYHWIKGNVSDCERQLFVFDEIDKISPKIFNWIKPVLDYNRKIDGVDYSKCIFIFLSNTGSSSITSITRELWQKGRVREDIELKDFENIIMLGAFNEKGGFHQSEVISGSLIDHYVPFLPMEQQHVKMCILHEFEIRNVTTVKPKHVQAVFETLEWGPDPEKLYSKTGCKRLSQKVAMIVQKYYR